MRFRAATVALQALQCARAGCRAAAMAITKVEQVVRDLSRPSASLRSFAQRAEHDKVVEVLKQFLLGQVKGAVRQAAQVPVLYSYSPDGNPLVTKERLAVESGVAGRQAKVRRVGGSGQEHLVQQEFIRFRDHRGQENSVALVRDPLPLSEGKDHWAVCACLRDFFESPRALGHSGLVIEHFSVDCALFSPLRRVAL